jgi:carboxylate-amine ligase
MSLSPFSGSEALTLGVELELQLLSREDYDLTPQAHDVLRRFRGKKAGWEIKPELTSSMIEVSTSIHRGFDSLLAELNEICESLSKCARFLNIAVCGGGTHPFQRWSDQQIFDRPRFHQISTRYGYLAKQFTVFGQHVHLGCSDGNEALGLLHRLSRYIPQFIALSACSPFVQGQDTGFDSARLNSVFAFPLSGRAPLVTTWDDFSRFFEKMSSRRIVESMKDFYWDLRPKPEYGTIELRVCDTPLRMKTAAALAIYMQILGRYLIVEKPFAPDEDLYTAYTFNRFQACRFGKEGLIVDPQTGEQRTIAEDILDTLRRIEGHAIDLRAEDPCRIVRAIVLKGNEADWQRTLVKSGISLTELVRRQAVLWETGRKTGASPETCLPA